MTKYYVSYRVSQGEREKAFDSMLEREIFIISYGAYLTVLREWVDDDGQLSEAERFARNDELAPTWRDEYQARYGEAPGKH